MPEGISWKSREVPGKGALMRLPVFGVSSGRGAPEFPGLGPGRWVFCAGLGSWLGVLCFRSRRAPRVEGVRWGRNIWLQVPGNMGLETRTETPILPKSSFS